MRLVDQYSDYEYRVVFTDDPLKIITKNQLAELVKIIQIKQCLQVIQPLTMPNLTQKAYDSKLPLSFAVDFIENRR